MKNIFLKLLNNAVFGKPWKIFESIGTLNWKQQIKETYLVSETNCQTTKFFRENVLTIEIKITQILMSELFY